MSGELEAQAEWTPPGPVAEEYKVRKPAEPPTTTRGMLVHGFKRLFLIVGGISAVAVAVALGIVIFGGASAAETFPLVFIVTGAAVAGAGLWSVLGAGFGADWAPETGYEQVEKEGWVSDVFVYAGLGAVIVAIGVVLDFLL